MSKKVSDVHSENRDRSWGLWGNLSFAWANTPIKLARQGVLDLKDLYLPRNSTADVCYEEFCHEWESRTVVPEGEMSKRPLLGALLKLYGKRFFLGGVFKLAWSALVICGAFFFVRSLLLYVDEDEVGHAFDAEWKGWILATFFFVAATLWGLCLQRMGFICMSSAVKVRAALATAIARKAIQLNKISAEDTAAVVGFMANDLGKVYDGMLEFHYLWASPFEAFTIIGLLGSLVGKWALPAAGIVGIIIFIQYFFGWQIAMNKHKNSFNINERGHILQEILPAMKLVKYYAWEEFFENKLKKIRARESKLAFANIFFKTMNICLVFTTPPLCASVIFATYEFSEGRLDPTIAFTTLTLFNILRFPLVVLPKALRAASEGSTSLARIEKFLLDADKQINERAEADNDMHSEAALGIHVHRAAFRYEGHDGHGFKLTIPTFTCDPGEVVAVVGRVGAGKSALLDALLGNMPNEHGDCKVGGKLAYVPQTAWVQNMSIRENITFGLPFDQERYNQVIHACALEQDLAMLPQGDESMGGLRGMNLSGGQRQRVNVARAAYFGADTILLDNALSAVDHHTAEHMFTNCIKGLFASKAVVLVTHQLQFIRRCDKVAIVDHGKIQYFGPFNPTAQSILASYLPVPDEDTAGHTPGEDRRPKAKKDNKVALAKPEAKPRTSLPMGQAFKRYLAAGPGWKFYISVASGLVSQASRQMSDFWIRAWASDGYGHYLDRAIEKYEVNTDAQGRPIDAEGNVINDADNYDDLNGGYASQIYAGLYGAFTFAFWFIQVLRTGGFFLAGKAAADRIMRRSVHRVLYSPMGLYLAKPVGELLASFSSDQDKIDEALPDALHLAFVYAFIILSTAVTISVNIREFIAFAAVLILVTAIMLKLYLPAATQVKHLRATSAGSLVGLSAEVLEGLKVVQAYRHQNHFVREFTARTDRHHASIFNADSLNLWISFYCDFYGAVMLLALCYFAVAFAERGSAVVGLAFSNTIQLLVFYTWTLRLTTESISLAGSCEQLCWLAYKAPIDGQDDINNAGQTLETGLKWRQLKNIVIEDKKESRNKSKMLAHWPVDGRIEFDNVVMRYRPTAQPALNGVNLKIAHGEKVGIVGRTGSGKSTLLMALYRMFDLAEGTISVGGIDVNLLPLRKARRGLSIIPQEPVMFSGTLRENLDPYHEHSDFELYNLLVEAGLKEKAEAAGGLDGHVDGSGSDQWSVGQCQLVCLVRAALNKVPVVCMDEATAALDPHTEEIVLEVANRLFAERTTLTIAHRLEAVIECDTAVVMEQGKVAETGSPDTLLTDPNSWFTKLVEMAGPAEAASLRAAAKAHFEKRAAEYHQEGEYHP